MFPVMQYDKCINHVRSHRPVAGFLGRRKDNNVGKVTLYNATCQPANVAQLRKKFN